MLPVSSSAPPAIVEVHEMDFAYGAKTALHGINLAVEKKRVTALIGPSGCGKSTLLRCFNRMHDRVSSARVKYEGEIILQPSGVNIYDAHRLILMEMRLQDGHGLSEEQSLPENHL